MPLKADTITKDYVKDTGVFADIFNYYIYGGRHGADSAVVPVQKFCDV